MSECPYALYIDTATGKPVCGRTVLYPTARRPNGAGDVIGLGGSGRECIPLQMSPERRIQMQLFCSGNPNTPRPIPPSVRR